MIRRWLTLTGAIVLLAACGAPITRIDEDAKAAKAQAHEAVDAAQAAAQRVDELSRQAIQPAPPADRPARGE